jgi:hypothetical protein
MAHDTFGGKEEEHSSVGSELELEKRLAAMEPVVMSAV